MGCVIGGLALDEEIHHINVRYLCRDLIYVLRGIFWINNGCTFLEGTDQDYRRLFTQRRRREIVPMLVRERREVGLKYYNHLY